MVIGNIKIYLDIIIERNDSIYVPWELIEENSVGDEDNFEWKEDIELLISNSFDLPISRNGVEPGDRYQVMGDIEIIYTKHWTDCGYEYDLDFNFEDKDITIKQV